MASAPTWGEVVGDLGHAVGAALFELASQPRSEFEDGDGGGDGDVDDKGAPYPVLSPAEIAAFEKRLSELRAAHSDDFHRMFHP